MEWREINTEINEQENKGLSLTSTSYNGSSDQGSTTLYIDVRKTV